MKHPCEFLRLEDKKVGTHCIKFTNDNGVFSKTVVIVKRRLLKLAAKQLSQISSRSHDVYIEVPQITTAQRLFAQNSVW